MDECVIPDRLVQDLTNALCGYEMNLHRDYPAGAMTCIELASALALYAYGRGLRQLGEPHTREELLAELRSCIRPHQNRSSLNSRTAALLELALSCARISVKYEADVLKQPGGPTRRRFSRPISTSPFMWASGAPERTCPGSRGWCWGA